MRRFSLVRVIPSGGFSKGAPVKHVDKHVLERLLGNSRNISITKLASTLGMHRNTLSRKIKEYGLSREYTDITDGELETELRSFRDRHPDAGASCVISHLRDIKIRITRQRVRDLLYRIDGVGVRLRARAAVVRRVYKNPRPNAVWHCDGHLKAKGYGIYIHGFVDGFSRKVSVTVLWMRLLIQ